MAQPKSKSSRRHPREAPAPPAGAKAEVKAEVELAPQPAPKGGFIPQHFIICPECGFYLGAIYPLLFYVNMGHRLEKGSNANKLLSAPNLDGFEASILDALGIRNICCRTHACTNVDIEKLF